MAQVKLLKISSVGLPQEMDVASDQITLASFTVDGGGPVMSSTGLDLNNQDVSDVKNLDFNDPSTATIDQTGGAKLVDDLMFQSKENAMAVGAAVLFPVVSDAAGEVDALRIPVLAGIPTATPADGGEGYVIWDSTNNNFYIWDGSGWDNQSTVSDANRLANSYIADGALLLGDAVYISAADKAKKADVSAEGAGANVIGLAKAGVADTVAVDIISEGLFEGFSGLTAGARYYADPATAGGKTVTLPVGTGNVIVQLGYAKSTTKMQLQIQRLGRRA